MSRPKRARVLIWPSTAWRPFYHADTDSIRVRVEDSVEQDRINLLALSPAEPAHLGRRLLNLADEVRGYPP